MLDLSPAQMNILERLRDRGFRIVAFSMYAHHVGIRKGHCAALLSPAATRGFEILGAPCFLVAGNLSATVSREGKQWFVWKKLEIEATPARLAELAAFAAELSESLLPTT